MKASMPIDRPKKLSEIDQYYMEQAYQLALKAYAYNEVPVGAVVVASNGSILGTGYNKTERAMCQSAHAEINAITAACATVHDWRLEKTTIYITLQPCMMCYGLIALSRIERVVYGVNSPIYGIEVDSLDADGVYTKHTKFFLQGIMKNEIESLLKAFFKKSRD